MMRIWHKELIEVLPRKQLVSQWRECCAIARTVTVTGTPNHMLVNKVMNYPISHFITYAKMINDECIRRGCTIYWNRFERWLPKDYDQTAVSFDELFVGWHNHRYFEQCYYNLQEKFDCGGIDKREWAKIEFQRMLHLQSMLFKEE
jgi:uncharacterized protein (TIGR02328 family)